ncbi:hypothetical protein PMAYCL1PPCAC_27885, partial [Pristionchus mayeri]
YLCISHFSPSDYIHYADYKELRYDAVPFFDDSLDDRVALNSRVACRGPQAKKERLAVSNGLPLSAAEISQLSLSDLKKLLKADSLTE